MRRMIVSPRDARRPRFGCNPSTEPSSAVPAKIYGRTRPSTRGGGNKVRALGGERCFVETLTWVAGASSQPRPPPSQDFYRAAEKPRRRPSYVGQGCLHQGKLMVHPMHLDERTTDLLIQRLQEEMSSWQSVSSLRRGPEGRGATMKRILENLSCIADSLWTRAFQVGRDSNNHGLPTRGRATANTRN